MNYYATLCIAYQSRTLAGDDRRAYTVTGIVAGSVIPAISVFIYRHLRSNPFVFLPSRAFQ